MLNSIYGDDFEDVSEGYHSPNELEDDHQHNDDDDYDEELAAPSSSYSSRKRTRADFDDSPVDFEDVNVLDRIDQVTSDALNKQIGLAAGCVWNEKLPQYYDLTNIEEIKSEAARAYAIKGIPPNTIPVFFRLCLTIPSDAVMRYGAQTFDSFRNDEYGKHAFQAFMFLSIAFSDAGVGLNAAGESVRYSFTLHKRTFPKFTILYEPLVSKVTNDDSNPFLYTTDELETVMLLSQNNIRAFRVWYLFHDPSLVPWKMVDSQIHKIQVATGTINEHKEWTVEDEDIQRWAGSFEKPKNHYQMMQECERRNRVLRATDERNKKLRQEYLDLITNEKSHQFNLLFEINSRVAYFNNIQSYLLRCVSCPSKTILCHECRTKKNFLDNDRNSIDFSIENVLPLRAGSELAAMAEDYHLHPCIVRKLLDPLYSLTIDNPTVREYLSQLNISPIQTRLSNYQQGHLFTFPVSRLIFRVPVINIHAMKSYISSKLPWTFSALSVMLDVLENFTQYTLKDKQKAVVQKIWEGKETTQSYQALSVISEAYLTDETVFKPPIPQCLISPPLTSESTCGVNQGETSMVKAVDETGRGLITAKDDTDGYFSWMIEQRQRFTRLLPVIGKNDRICNKILRQFKLEGRQATLNIIHSQNPNITPVIREAAELLEKLQSKRDNTSIPRISSVDPNYSIFANYLINTMLYIEKTNACQASHLILLQMFHQRDRALHSSELESFEGFPHLVEHLIVCGRAATGKSEMIEWLKRNSLKSAIDSLTSSSEQSLYASQNLSDTMIVYDELGPQNDPRLAKNDRGKITETKQAATEYILRRQILTLRDGKNGSTDRRTTMVVVKMHRTMVILANDRLMLDAEISYWTRFGTVYTVGEPPRKGSPDSTALITPIRDADLRNFRCNNISIRQNWYIIMHAIHGEVAYCIKMGGMSFPCMRLLGIYRHALNRAMRRKFPFFGNDPRTIGRLWSQALTKTINNAIWTAFVSESNPFTDPKRGTVREFQISDIFIIEPYLMCTTEIAIYELTHMVCQYVIRTPDYNLAYAMAVEFGKYQQPGTEYRNTRHNNGDLPDKNYIRVGTYRTAEAFFTKRGLNSYMFFEQLRYLQNKLEMNVDYINPTDGRIIRNYRISAVLIDNAYHGPIPQNANVDFSIYGDELINISVEYLKFCEPKNIINYMFENAFEYQFTKERRVVVGNTIPLYPSLLDTYDMKPRPGRVLNVSSRSGHIEGINKAMSNGILFDQASVGLEDDASTSTSERLTYIYEEDPETIVYREWFTRCQIIIPESLKNLGPDAFLPNAVHDLVQTIHKEIPLYATAVKFTYPEEFKQQMDRQDEEATAGDPDLITEEEEIQELPPPTTIPATMTVGIYSKTSSSSKGQISKTPALLDIPTLPHPNSSAANKVIPPFVRNTPMSSSSSNIPSFLRIQ